MNTQLSDVTGFRGEKITELALTDFAEFDEPLFQPGFLGDKWPAIDFYVELNSVRGKRPYFFVQTKSTRSKLTNSSANLRFSIKKQDIEGLLRLPGPTYIIGVHEPSHRAFIRSIHLGLAKRAFTTIPIANELTPPNLKVLHTEVCDFWNSTGHKPRGSHFS